MKDTTDVEVELRKIYSFGRRSHYLNGAPRPTKPNPNYGSERPDLPSLPSSEQHVEGEWTSTDIGGDQVEKGRIPDRLSGA
jgi:hypothetical protein